MSDRVGFGTGQGGGLIYKINGDTRRLAYGSTFWILVWRRVFRAKRQYFKPPRSRFGFREETELREEKQKSNFLFSSFFSFLSSLF